jgi:TatD DNase family protein
MLEKHEFRNAVLHWFTGTIASLERAIELGCWFSVNPAMIRSKNGKLIVARLSRDRVLTETDGPHVRIGSRPAEPTDVQEVLACLGTAWGVSHSEAEDAVAANFARLIG